MRFAKRGMLVGAATAAVALMALNVNAQSGLERAKIPFAFHVGRTSLPAGSYILRMQGDALRITDENGHTVNVLCNPSENPNVDARSRLVFKGSGDTWFLSQVRWQGYGAARDVIQPRSTEVELSKITPVERVIASNKR